MTRSDYDALVVGAGPAGLTAALALAKSGMRTAVAGPPFSPDPKRPDTRTTALLRASVALLRNIGVWDACQPDAAALDIIRIIDDTGRLARAPEVAFDSKEIGGGPFGYNIPNTALVAALYAHADTLPNLDVIETTAATKIEPDADAVTVTLAEGRSISARLVAGADGRKSLCRDAAGLSTTSWSYPQVALACNFEHSDPHGNASNEFHRPAGPFTTVPLPGNASSLVWVETAQEAERLVALSEERFATEIEERSFGCLGAVTSVGPRASFPLSGMRVRGFAARRIALVGEAAHVIPPIGAQGLNLGFRDAAVLAECAQSGVESSGDTGSGATLGAYDRSRRADVDSRTLAVDLLNRSLISGFVPLHVARGIGLHLLAGLSPLRRMVMREGIAPQFGLPKLMRPAASTAT
ncbi:MAG: UbiH/UbiF family hydroxylase [Pseudomonadota bacterium]